MLNSNFIGWCKETFNNFFHWMWFGLIISLVPLLYSIWRVMGTAGCQSCQDAFVKSVSHGELILVCVSMIGVSIGDLAKKHRISMALYSSVLGCSLCVALFAVFVFGEIPQKNYTDVYIANTSLIVFAGTILTSIATLLFPKYEVIKES